MAIPTWTSSRLKKDFPLRPSVIATRAMVGKAMQDFDLSHSRVICIPDPRLAQPRPFELGILRALGGAFRKDRLPEYRRWQDVSIS